MILGFTVSVVFSSSEVVTSSWSRIVDVDKVSSSLCLYGLLVRVDEVVEVTRCIIFSTDELDSLLLLTELIEVSETCRLVFDLGEGGGLSDDILLRTGEGD